jgi:hypothetical protein
VGGLEEPGWLGEDEGAELVGVEGSLDGLAAGELVDGAGEPLWGGGVGIVPASTAPPPRHAARSGMRASHARKDLVECRGLSWCWAFIVLLRRSFVVFPTLARLDTGDHALIAAP